MASIARPLSVIAAIRQPGDTEEVAETRGQLANAKHVAARHWEALVDSRRLCAQVSDAHAELQLELQRSARRLRVLEQELEALHKEHKECVLAYASVEGSSCNIERHQRQEIEAADMLRGKMQQGYKEQLNKQQGLVAELCQENKCLMEDKAALIEEVARLHRQLDIVQTTRATPTSPASMARSPVGLGIGGSPSSPFTESLTSGVAILSGADSPLLSSSVASHKSGAFSCLKKDLALATHELSRGTNTVQTPGATPAMPANTARSLSFGSATSTPSTESPIWGFASLSAPDSPIIPSYVASHDSDVFDCLMQDVARVAQELSRGANTVQTPGATPAGLANMASPPLASSPSSQQRAMLTTPHPLPVYEGGQMVVHRVFEPKAGGWHVRVHGSNARRVTFRRRAACSKHRVFDPKAGSPHVRVHGSNPRKVTLWRRASWRRPFLAAPRAHWQGLRSSPCPDHLLKVTVRGVPVTKQHPSSPLEVASSPAELDADAAASNSNSSSPSVSPVGTLPSAFLSEMPSPMADVEALITMDPSPDTPKGDPLVSRAQRLTLASPSNKATAVPFFASTRPKDACAGCPKQHCSAAFAKCAQVHHETVPLQHHHVYSTLLWWCNACTPERQATPDVGLSAGGVEARSLSIGGGLATNAQRSCLNPPPAGSPTSGVACLSDADSPMISSSVTSHDSDVFDCLMEDLVLVTQELSRGANIMQTPGATPAGPANMVMEREANSWHGQLHDSNPLRVTFRRGAEPSGPIPLFTLASPSPHPYSFIPFTVMPLLVPSALAADTVGGSSLSPSLSGSSSPSRAGQLLAASYAPAPCLDNPLEGTVRAAPVTSQLPSSPLKIELSPAELDADAAASTNSPSPLSPPITSIHSALSCELPSPMACVEASCAIGTPCEGPKPSPLVNMSPRPALANLTNGLTPQARVTPGLAASAQTPGKATPPTPAAGRHLSAFLQRSLSPCPRPRTSFPRVVVTGNRSACSIRSSRGSEASPGNSPALELLSPARALGNRPRAVDCFTMALPSDTAPRAGGIPNLPPTVSFWTLVSSPSAPSPPKAVERDPRGSLLGPRASGCTPAAPFAQPAVSVHDVVSLPDQGFSPGLSLPEAQGPIPSPAVQSAVSISSAAVLLQLTPLQQPLQEGHDPSAGSVAASNCRTRSVPSSAVSSGQASRRSNISNSIAGRPAWSAAFSRSSAVNTRLAEDVTPISRRLTAASPHMATGSPQPSRSPVRAVLDSPVVEPSSVPAIRRTGSNAAAARLMSTARIRGSTRTAAQPGGVRPTAAQSSASRAAVQGTSRAGSTRAGPAAPAPAAQRPATRSSKAAASIPAEQSVAVHRQAASGRSGAVQRVSGPASIELRQAIKGKVKTVNKQVAPIRSQPARRAKDPGHTWKC